MLRIVAMADLGRANRLSKSSIVYSDRFPSKKATQQAYVHQCTIWSSLRKEATDHKDATQKGKKKS